MSQSFPLVLWPGVKTCFMHGDTQFIHRPAELGVGDLLAVKLILDGEEAALGETNMEWRSV